MGSLEYDYNGFGPDEPTGVVSAGILFNPFPNNYIDLGIGYTYSNNINRYIIKDRRGENSSTGFSVYHDYQVHSATFGASRALASWANIGVSLGVGPGINALGLKEILHYSTGDDTTLSDKRSRSGGFSVLLSAGLEFYLHPDFLLEDRRFGFGVWYRQELATHGKVTLPGIDDYGFSDINHNSPHVEFTFGYVFGKAPNRDRKKQQEQIDGSSRATTQLQTTAKRFGTALTEEDLIEAYRAHSEYLNGMDVMSGRIRAEHKNVAVLAGENQLSVAACVEERLRHEIDSIYQAIDRNDTVSLAHGIRAMSSYPEALTADRAHVLEKRREYLVRNSRLADAIRRAKKNDITDYVRIVREYDILRGRNAQYDRLRHSTGRALYNNVKDSRNPELASMFLAHFQGHTLHTPENAEYMRAVASRKAFVEAISRQDGADWAGACQSYCTFLNNVRGLPGSAAAVARDTADAKNRTVGCYKAWQEWNEEKTQGFKQLRLLLNEASRAERNLEECREEQEKVKREQHDRVDSNREFSVSGDIRVRGEGSIEVFGHAIPEDGDLSQEGTFTQKGNMVIYGYTAESIVGQFYKPTIHCYHGKSYGRNFYGGTVTIYAYGRCSALDLDEMTHMSKRVREAEKRKHEAEGEAANLVRRLKVDAISEAYECVLGQKAPSVLSGGNTQSSSDRDLLREGKTFKARPPDSNPIPRPAEPTAEVLEDTHRTQPKAVQSAGQRLSGRYSRNHFKRLILGKTPSQIKALLGAPITVDEMSFGEDWWQYDFQHIDRSTFDISNPHGFVTFDPVSGADDAQLTITVNRRTGRVTEITFM